jgi:probable phosphoglycerate mutase
MTALVLLRHAPTEWNRAKRLQGRADISILASSRDELAARRLPDGLETYRAIASPLTRCRETAGLLGLTPEPEERLIEMDWGDYEGHTLAELVDQRGFKVNEARGLDFCPPSGESPRDVQTRITPLLAELAAAGRPTLAVTHRGVIRAVYAWATGWDMTGEAPDEVELYALQYFTLAQDGTPSIDRLNVPLILR